MLPKGSMLFEKTRIPYAIVAGEEEKALPCTL